MKKFIYKNITGKRVITLFILSTLIYLFMLLVTIPHVMKYSEGLKLTDMIPTGYDAEYINSLLNTLGEDGRNAYLFRQIPVDLVYPLLFAVSWCLILAWFLNKLGKLNGPMIYLCLLPVFAGLFDYFENLGMIAILILYPHNPDLLSMITSIFTIIKSITTTLYFLILIVSIIFFIFKKLR